MPHVPVISIDLDNTLAEYQRGYTRQNKIGEPRPGAVTAVQGWKEKGYEILIWTVRNQPDLIREWLDKHEIPYDYLNETPNNQPENSSQKPNADVFIDDKNVDGRQAWSDIEKQVVNRVAEAEEDHNEREKMKTAAVTQIVSSYDYQRWRAVPDMVCERYKEAADIKYRISKAMKDLPQTDGYGSVWWNPSTKAAWVSLSDMDGEEVYSKWSNRLKNLGIKKVKVEAEASPPSDGEWIYIKSAAGPVLDTLQAPAKYMGKLTGGPSPLTNTIVGGLMGGGLGYGGGWLLEKLLPQKHFRKGRLRKVMGLLGAGVGAVPGITSLVANKQMSDDAGENAGWMRSLIRPNANTPVPERLEAYMQNIEDGRVKRSAIDAAAAEILNEFEPRITRSQQSIDAFIKLSYTFGAAGGGIESIPMDAFGQTIWNDVHNHVRAANNPYGTKSMYGNNKQPMYTPPAVGAAVAGLVSGIGQQHGNPGLLSPRHFISGLAAAGLDMAIAKVAGGILGTLGGLKPESQSKLQNLGIWGGLMRGIASSVFG